MYGTGLPILYPIALASLVLLYVIDRVSLLYVNKCPPEYDGVINARALDILPYATFFGFGVGFWMLSNK